MRMQTLRGMGYSLRKVLYSRLLTLNSVGLPSRKKWVQETAMTRKAMIIKE